VASGSGCGPTGGGGTGIMMALLPVVLSMPANRGGGARSGGGGGGLGDILGQVLGGGGTRSGAGGATGAGSGLGGLLEQMQRAGFEGQARSWVGTGQNMSISPDAIGQIFGQGGLDEIARHANLTPEQTSEGLSQLLPEVVDRVTPGGQEPDFDQLLSNGDGLRRQMESDHGPDHRRDRGADRRPGDGDHAVGAHRWSCSDRERAPPPDIPASRRAECRPKR
jgi:uncharacterized protein YidB (DUF937 family)